MMDCHRGWLRRLRRTATQPGSQRLLRRLLGPSGRTIVSTSVVEGHRNIWTVDVDGGNLRLLTTGPGKRQYPAYSTDGGWIYFGKRDRRTSTSGVFDRMADRSSRLREMGDLRPSRRQTAGASCISAPWTAEEHPCCCGRLPADRRTNSSSARTALGLSQRRLLLPVRFERPACAIGSVKKVRHSPNRSETRNDRAVLTLDNLGSSRCEAGLAPRAVNLDVHLHALVLDGVFAMNGRVVAFQPWGIPAGKELTLM